jgi:hypothetical protein
VAGHTGRDMDSANLLTKRHWIAELARRKPGAVLYSLNHVIDFEWMREAYLQTRNGVPKTPCVLGCPGWGDGHRRGDGGGL